MAAKMSTLVDNFATNDLSSLWSGTAGTVTWAPGSVAVQVDTGYSSFLQSSAAYDLTSSHIQARITPYLNTGTQTYIQLPVSSAQTNFIVAGQQANQSFFSYSISNVTTNAFVTSYDPVNHSFYQLREAGGTVAFDASPDGANWVNLYSVAAGTLTFALTSLVVRVQGGDFRSDPVGVSYVSYVNCQPPPLGEPHIGPTDGTFTGTDPFADVGEPDNLGKDIGRPDGVA